MTTNLPVYSYGDRVYTFTVRVRHIAHQLWVASAVSCDFSRSDGLSKRWTHPAEVRHRPRGLRPHRRLSGAS
ncbi:hypothetical protein LAUMK35_02392 [Mycobacterium pseudokansasii]|uniref:Uncharacterized protein n=1 Tax=Mycobacterium pseudokansasii TaxID=2341080 RepID=A0A498QPV1_9MYCO|nr:hypothetical protein LAUMK35_02392 [Mycobacterium pseudokansasii]VAZ94685.1 hypothetical protein LAUMK21_02393 [Mycobacterium pseudokansasii]VBA49964.1 hypothetical protein LAUMK142_02283 [Mycobacterium pseudokansasii]